MNNVIVYGATWCGPCGILKDWLGAGGLSDQANYEYVDIDANPNDLQSMGIAIGDSTLGQYIPAVVILDNQGTLITWKNGATQTWIQSNINQNPVTNEPYYNDSDFGSGDISTPSDAPNKKKKADDILNLKNIIIPIVLYKIFFVTTQVL